MTKCSIVIDLGFGDAGKGLTTDFLASQAPEKSLVVRFSGGHQIGHTVTTKNTTHTFSNFGSGTLKGVPTYYSEHTTLFPPAILSEGNYLKAYRPKLYFHPLAMITTMYDVAYNRALEKQQKHGSCGLGFGTTIARNRKEVYFFANDIQFPWIVEQRLNSIKRYYGELLLLQSEAIQERYRKELEGYDDDLYMENCEAIRFFYSISPLSILAPTYDHFIFEGSQGILLDTKHGFHPHTTWSYTTSKNAVELIKTHLKATEIQLYYVTRCYHTRHGNGPIPQEKSVILQNNQNEANTTNEFQGVFRTMTLSTELLNYALACDAFYHQDIAVTKNMMITCLDQLPDFSPEELIHKINIEFKKVYTSHGPMASTIRQMGQ